jgi:GH15 family glucan-1,4-alpha-glucosidase
MGRPVMLSNGQLMVGLDENGLVHDFYYPYVGLDNLTTAHSVHHKIGIWVNGKFSWVDDGTWTTKVNFEEDALISDIVMESKVFGVEFRFKDFIDHEHNVFVRRINIANKFNKKSDIRLFLHQVFQISRAGRADTALYVPDSNYVLDYKGRCALLIYGKTVEGDGFDQYAIGNYAIEGKQGTFVDAEDGELSGNAVEHGGVDSVIRFKVSLEPGESHELDYWIIAADSQYDCEVIHNIFLKDTVEKRESMVRSHWQKWLAIGKSSLDEIDERYRSMVKKSMLLIAAHCDKRGGILASGDSSIFNYGRDYYCYCWPRDSAYAIWPLIRMGYREEPKRFFEFCRDIVNKNGYLMHKYQPDKSIGSTWHPLVHDSHKELAIQEDETAIIICMLGEYFDHSQDSDFVESVYSTFIKPAANFLSSFIDKETNLPHASYDIWEEKFLTTTYTCALVEHALRRAAKFAEQFEFPDDSILWLETAENIEQSSEILFEPDDQYYRKGYHLQSDGSLELDNTLDVSSMYGVLMFKNADKEAYKLGKTVDAIERKLTNLGINKAVIRYENDWYMRSSKDESPNPWIICTLWLAQYYIQIKQPDKAEAALDWVKLLAYPSGALSEQVNPKSGQPVGVAPLVWSHAEFINTALDLADESIK